VPRAVGPLQPAVQVTSGRSWVSPVSGRWPPRRCAVTAVHAMRASALWAISTFRRAPGWWRWHSEVGWPGPGPVGQDSRLTPRSCALGAAASPRPARAEEHRPLAATSRPLPGDPGGLGPMSLPRLPHIDRCAISSLIAVLQTPIKPDNSPGGKELWHRLSSLCKKHSAFLGFSI